MDDEQGYPKSKPSIHMRPQFTDGFMENPMENPMTTWMINRGTLNQSLPYMRPQFTDGFMENPHGKSDGKSNDNIWDCLKMLG